MIVGMLVGCRQQSPASESDNITSLLHKTHVTKEKQAEQDRCALNEPFSVSTYAGKEKREKSAGADAPPARYSLPLATYRLPLHV